MVSNSPSKLNGVSGGDPNYLLTGMALQEGFGTVDGSEIRRSPLFTSLYTSQVVQDFFHQQ